MATVMLADSLDMQAAGRLAAELAASPGSVELDASAVTHVGGLAAQLILAGLRDGRLTVRDASPGFADGLARLGIGPDRLG
jgi:hypothetical protein